jgi:orotidine-5'-phosphate decarboxylase
MREKIIVAIDLQEREALNTLLEELRGEAKFVKIGMELFYTFGPEIVMKLKEMNFKVFLDLKVHDIPNTTKKTIKTITKLGADIINVHALGGAKMLQAAVEGIDEAIAEDSTLIRPQLIGVTQLTSTTSESLNKDLGIEINLEQNIIHLAKLCYQNKLDGVVCSAFEVESIKSATSEDFICITPGIRPKTSPDDDQKRVMTPVQALLAGSDFLVIGRPITQATSPKKAYLDIVKEII